MKRNLRFYCALFFAKGTALVLKLIGRKATSMPGSWAIIICPDFLGRIEKPKKIIAVTGTNGKTTVSNMIEDILEQNGEDFVCNREGSNVPTGVVSALIANSTFFGKPKKDLAVFEMDERSTVRIFPHLQPDILLVTNIFRDSYRRNAHTEYIYDILNGSIPEKTKLILNGDDPLCSRIREKGERVFFGMEPLDFEDGQFKNLVRDGASCPRCSSALTYDFTRYHHIGICHCESCGYTFPQRDYRITEADRDKGQMKVEFRGESYQVRLTDPNPINMYNQLSAIAVLSEFGCKPEQIVAAFAHLKIAESRLKTTEIAGKTLVRFVAKGQNPVACSRAFDAVKSFPGQKCVVLMLDDVHDAAHSVENIAWFYDTDFEFLNDPQVTQIVVGGARHWDTYVRLLLADVPAAKIKHAESENEMVNLIDFNTADSFIIYDDIYRTGTMELVQKGLVKYNEN